MSTNKVALVTGSSRGIGAAIAEALSDAGYSVCINYIQRSDKAEELAARIRAKGGRCITQQADVADREAVFAMVRRTETPASRSSTSFRTSRPPSGSGSST